MVKVSTPAKKACGAERVNTTPEKRRGNCYGIAALPKTDPDRMHYMQCELSLDLCMRNP